MGLENHKTAMKSAYNSETDHICGLNMWPSYFFTMIFSFMLMKPLKRLSVILYMSIFATCQSNEIQRKICSS